MLESRIRHESLLFRISGMTNRTDTQSMHTCGPKSFACWRSCPLLAGITRCHIYFFMRLHNVINQHLKTSRLYSTVGRLAANEVMRIAEVWNPSANMQFRKPGWGNLWKHNGEPRGTFGQSWRYLEEASAALGRIFGGITTRVRLTYLAVHSLCVYYSWWYY